MYLRVGLSFGAFIRLRLNLGCEHDSWTTLRNVLLPHDRVTVSMQQCKDGSTVHFRKSVKPDPKQKKICNYSPPTITRGVNFALLKPFELQPAD